jgi:hypothetical protein
MQRQHAFDAIQHFVATARIPSIHSGEQTLNPGESPIRRRFVRRLFHEPAKDLGKRLLFALPLAIARPDGHLLPVGSAPGRMKPAGT